MSDKTIVRIEYKRFNTFLSDYLRSINRGWLFMKMKHKYPVGTKVTFLITVGEDKQPLALEGTAAYHGTSDEGKEGVGFYVSSDSEESEKVKKRVETQCREIFGENLTSRIMALVEKRGNDNQ